MNYIFSAKLAKYQKPHILLKQQKAATTPGIQSIRETQPTKKRPDLRKWKRIITFADVNARMAESVDALVSNTSGAIRAGSIPAPGTDNG